MATPSTHYRRTRQQTQRQGRLHLRLSDEELAAVTLAAGRAGLSPSGYAATAVVAAALDMKPPPPRMNSGELRVLVDASEQLARVGNLLNQIARSANAGQGVPGAALRLLERTEQLLARVDGATARAASRR